MPTSVDTAAGDNFLDIELSIYWFKIFFGYTANRACPCIRDIFKSSTWLDAMIRVTKFWIVDITTNFANIFLHSFFFFRVIIRFNYDCKYIHDSETIQIDYLYNHINFIYNSVFITFVQPFEVIDIILHDEQTTIIYAATTQSHTTFRHYNRDIFSSLHSHLTACPSLFDIRHAILFFQLC